MGLIRRARAGVGRRLGRVVHHRGRRAVPAAAARRLVRAARGRVVRPRRDAADLRGAQGPALPVVLRRHPDPAHALAVDAARARGPRRTGCARRSAGPTSPARCSGTATCSAWCSSCLLLVGAVNLATRRRRAVPQADRVRGRDRPGAGRARAGARGRPAAPGHRRLLAGRGRRVPDLAVDRARRRAGVGAGAVRQARPSSSGRRRRPTAPRGGRRSGPTGPRPAWPCSAWPASPPDCRVWTPTPGRCWPGCWCSPPSGSPRRR